MCGLGKRKRGLLLLLLVVVVVVAAAFARGLRERTGRLGVVGVGGR